MQFDDISDAALIRMAKDGDMPAFEALFNRYKRPILNFIHRMIGNRQTAEEVAQEVFVNVYKNLDVIDPERKFTSWLYTVARNLSKNSLRDKKYNKDISLDTPVHEGDDTIKLQDVLASDQYTPDMIAQDNELNDSAQKVLDALPEKYREVIALCSIQGLSCKEAATVIGCSVPTVFLRLNRAKALFIKSIGLDDMGGKQ